MYIPFSYTFTWGESSSINILDFQGKAAGKSFPVELPQYPLTKEQIKDQVMQFDESYRNLLAKNLVLRDFWPATSNIIVDSSDRIWAFSFQKEEGEPFSFRVFDRNGTRLADGEIEEIPAAILKNRLYYIHENGDEEVFLTGLGFDI